MIGVHPRARHDKLTTALATPCVLRITDPVAIVRGLSEQSNAPEIPHPPLAAVEIRTVVEAAPTLPMATAPDVTTDTRLLATAATPREDRTVVASAILTCALAMRALELSADTFI